MIDNNLLLKVSKEYECKDCNYNSRNKNNYVKHLNTRKHINTIKYNKNLQKLPTLENYACECGKNYPYRASLFNHKKRCRFGKCEKPEEDSIESIKSIKTKLMVSKKSLKCPNLTFTSSVRDDIYTNR